MESYHAGSQLPLSDKYILWDVRLSRIVMAVLVGSMLAVSGTALQGLFKNPLATGDLIGLTSGATLMAAIAIVLGSSFRAYLPEAVQFSLVGLSAFVGALLSMLLVYRISTSGGKTNVVMMLLTGVAITAIGFSITGFLIYISKDDQLRDLTFWNLGSGSGNMDQEFGFAVCFVNFLFCADAQRKSIECYDAW